MNNSDIREKKLAKLRLQLHRIKKLQKEVISVFADVHCVHVDDIDPIKNNVVTLTEINELRDIVIKKIGEMYVSK